MKKLLITPKEINQIAFMKPFQQDAFKGHHIRMVNNKVRSLLGKKLYKKVLNNPDDYAVLLNDYIKPYMAFAVKTLTMYTIISDSGLSPDEVISYQNAVKSAEKASLYHYEQLIKEISENYGFDRKLMSGFIVKRGGH